MLDEEIIIDFIRTYTISICTYYLNLKIINKKEIWKYKEISFFFIEIFIITLISEILKFYFSFPYIIIWIGLFISLIFVVKTKKDFAYSMLITTVSLSANYIIFGISILGNFLINRINGPTGTRTQDARLMRSVL